MGGKYERHWKWYRNISDLVLKEVDSICKTKNPFKEQINEYKMTKRQLYKNFTNLSQEKLNAINNKKKLCQK